MRVCDMWVERSHACSHFVLCSTMYVPMYVYCVLVTYATCHMHVH